MARPAWAQAVAYAQLDSIPWLSHRLTTCWSGVAAVAATGAAAGAEVQGLPDGLHACGSGRQAACQAGLDACLAGWTGRAGFGLVKAQLHAFRNNDNAT